MEGLSELQVDVARLTAAMVAKWRGRENQVAEALAQNLAGFVAIAAADPDKVYEAISVLLKGTDWRSIRAEHFGATTLGSAGPMVVAPPKPYIVGNPKRRKPQ